MVDVFTKAKRSALMARIRGRNTQPELVVRKIAHSLGYRFRLHRRDLPGTPDLVFPGRRSVVFVHGCFWHAHPGCKLAARPKTRPEFWQAKLEGNRRRDEAAIRELRRFGWRVLVVWECQLRKADRLVQRLASFLGATGAKPVSAPGKRLKL